MNLTKHIVSQNPSLHPDASQPIESSSNQPLAKSESMGKEPGMHITALGLVESQLVDLARTRPEETLA